jgi:hypothetical protein
MFTYSTVIGYKYVRDLPIRVHIFAKHIENNYEHENEFYSIGRFSFLRFVQLSESHNSDNRSEAK